MWTRASTFLVWALAAGSLAFWGLKLLAAATPPPPGALVASANTAPRGDLSRLLGVDAPPEAPPEVQAAAPDPRFQLVGVVSPRSPGAASEGLAVIVVDDKPARAYRVGAVVDGQTVLQSVNPRGASLGPRGGTAAMSLDLPPPAAAATGQLPAAMPMQGNSYQPPSVPPQRFQRPAMPVQQVAPEGPQQIGPRTNMPTDQQVVAPVMPQAPGQLQGFNRSGLPLR